MHAIKIFLKSLLPQAVRQPLLNQYHLLTAVAANIRYGFPTKRLKVIMVTGTNGKTTTATLIADMLTAAGHKVGLNTTAFYRYGETTVAKEGSRTLADAFELQRMFAMMKQAGCEYIVLEATSMGLDQHRLWGVPCEAAIMTNLTQDHLDYHGTMERYAAAKAKLFARRPRLIVLNRDDDWYDAFNHYLARERKVNYGTHPDATCRITDVALARDGSTITLVFDGAQTLKIRTNLPGKFNVYNVAAAASTGYYLGIEAKAVVKGLESVRSVPGRLERVAAGQPFEVVVDYAHTPDALANVLSTLKSLTKGELILVFGATGDRDRTKRPVMGAIAAAHADRIYVTDEETYTEDPAAIRQALITGVKQAKKKVRCIELPDRRQAIEKAFLAAKSGDIVLLTGMGHELSRNMGGTKIAWNEAEVAREVLAGQGYRKKQR